MPKFSREQIQKPAIDLANKEHAGAIKDFFHHAFLVLRTLVSEKSEETEIETKKIDNSD